MQRTHAISALGPSAFLKGNKPSKKPDLWSGWGAHPSPPRAWIDYKQLSPDQKKGKAAFCLAVSSQLSVIS